MGPEILLRMVPAEKECLVVRLREGTGAVFWDLEPLRVVKARESAIVLVHGAMWWKVVWIVVGRLWNQESSSLSTCSCFLLL